MRLGTASNRDELVLRCMPLVRRVAANVASRLPASVELSDLTQEGFVGLIHAAQKFDEGKGVRFWTYAELRIRGAMLDSLRGLDSVPRSVRRKRRALDKATAELEGQLGRAARDEELAKAVELSVEELRIMREQVRSAENRQPADGFDVTLAQLSDPQALDPHEGLERTETEALLSRAIEALTERERLVITLYYHEELTMKEVGEVLGVNESRVSQIHSKAIRHLRRRFQSLSRPTSAP
jgi:RNA polymerase sigma factor for flagellar operon FliA